jgi:prepilin-type N-terminal cleavage/methylation domain-containing protein
LSNRRHCRASTARRAGSNIAGFTLLEAIVALAIIGMALVPILSFISISMSELIKAGESNDRSFVMQDVIAMMDSVNPSTNDAGSLPVNDKVVAEWTSKVIVPPAGGTIVSNSGLPTRNLGFYNVHITVSRSGEKWFHFDMRKVGYVDVQPFGNPAAEMK